MNPGFSRHTVSEMRKSKFGPPLEGSNDKKKDCSPPRPNEPWEECTAKRRPCQNKISSAQCMFGKKLSSVCRPRAPLTTCWISSWIRGAELSAGKFRSTQNSIGLDGAPLSEAIFVPPPLEQMPQALDELERFLHHERELPVLIHCGLANCTARCSCQYPQQPKAPSNKRTVSFYLDWGFHENCLPIVCVARCQSRPPQSGQKRRKPRLKLSR